MKITEEESYKLSRGPILGMRHLQVMMLFLAMVICYTMRVNISMAIVVMTDKDTEGPFDWSMQIQSVILSSFFWGYVVLQVPSGEIAARFGGKILLTICISVNSAVSLLIPLGAYYGGWQLLCACRVLQGLSQGCLYPTMHNLIGKWVPVQEKSRLGAAIYGGAMLGTALQMMVSGFIADYWGWPAIFYANGALGAIWVIIYVFLGSDSPQRSKMIGNEERLYIQTSLGQIGEQTRLATPWKKLATSLSFISLIVVHSGHNWGFWTLMTEIPSYMKQVLGVDIKANGLMSALPYLAMYLLSFPFGFLSDYFLAKKWISISACRKLSSSIGEYGPGLALIALCYVPPGDVIMAVTLLTLVVGLNAGHMTGYLLVHIDMAPNFAGTMMGITNCLANIVSIIAPLVAGLILQDETDTDQWRQVFYVASAVYIATNTIFIIFGTSERQSWNEPETKEITSERLLGMRHLMALIMLLATTVSYATRVSMSVGIVAMTSNNSYGYPVFDWSRGVQDTILSSFFWGYIILQIPAGYIAGRFGSKYILLVCMGTTGVFNLLVPMAAIKGGYMAVCACRIVIGLAQGLLYPSLHGVIGYWVPVNERSRLGTFVYSGAQLGTIIELLTSGFLSASSWGWPSVFYVAGITCLVWSVLWVIVGDSTPGTSRWISKEEKKFIEMNAGSTELGHGKMPTPWKGILTSLPFWAILLAHSGQSLGFWTLLTELPSYMKYVLNVDIKENGMLSALPYVAMFILSLIFSWMAEFLVNRNIIRLVTSRKIFNTIAHWGPAVALLGLSYLPAGNLSLSVIILIITVGLNGAHYVGFMLSHIDLSPNHASTMMGITNGIGAVLSILAPLSVSLVVEDETSAKDWRKVFFISVAFYFLVNLFYLLFISADIQEWNDTKPTKTIEDGENKSEEKNPEKTKNNVGEHKF